MFVGSRLECDSSADFVKPGVAAQVDLPDEIVPRFSDPSDARVNKPGIVILCDLPRRAELDEHIIDRKPLRRLLSSDDRAIARPGIVLWSRDNVSSNRIQHDIAQHFQRIGILIDEDSMEATLKEMTNPSESAVEVLRITAIEPLHSTRESFGGQLNHQMKVIRHQRICSEDPVESIDTLAEEFEEMMAVPTVAKDFASLIAANGDMPE
ncbi:MAG TPA: hypothetical protein VER58_01265 [Thermoanaerobaculia bacterium]|nr:hypothetical protein [Thermoanaerobaculia bacterium]